MQAKGPNALNMHAYTNGQESETQFVEQGTSQRPIIDGKAIQDQFDNFVKDMQKYDKILSEVAKNIYEIQGQTEFSLDFYPKFITDSTYEEDQQKKIVANTDPQMAKIIQNLQKTNKNYKEQVRSWVQQFAKTAKLTQVLIKQNTILRQSIQKKNKQIVKLIEGIGQAQNQEISELIEHLEELKEENGVLKEHLLQLKDDITHKKQEQQRIEQALDKTMKEQVQLEKTKVQAEDQEEHLSKTSQLIEQWKTQTEKRKKKLQKEKENLVGKKRQLIDEKDKIERQLVICSKQKKDLENGLKKTFKEEQTEKYRLIEEINDLGDKISKTKQESRFYQQQSTKNINKKTQYQKVAKQYQKKILEQDQAITTIKKELSQSQQKQIGLQCQIQFEKYDIELLKKELKELQQKEKKEGDGYKKILKKNEETKNKQVQEWHGKINQAQRQYAMKILQEKSQLSTKEKQLQRWEQKVYDKKEQLSDLKMQLKQIKDNQVKLAQLKSKLLNQESH